MDIGLPDINGLEVVRKIRETNQKVVIIAQTAYAMTDDRQKALEAGCNDYIAKPIKTKVFLKKINEFCN
jgi:CheY-like chemotaxis protein